MLEVADIRATLLGRSRECHVLDRLVAGVLTGGSQVLVLRGDPGVGKSALLRYLFGQVSSWRVISAGGVESEMELAYSALHQLCGPLLDHLEELPAPQRDALARVFGLSSGPAPDRLLVALATLSLCAQAAEHQPLACLIDDAQWVDRASAQVLSFVARRLLAERVALVCAARAGTGDDVLPGMPVLAVRGLPDADARRLLLSTVHGPLDASVSDRIVAESHGNPLALLELPRTWTAAELAGGFGPLHSRPVIGKIEQSYVQRLQALPFGTQLLTLTAAAEPLGDPVLLHSAAEALGLDMAAAAPAVDAGLLDVRGHVQFAHPLVRSATYHAAAASDRRRVHRALAEVTNPEVDPDRRAWHRACATAAPDEQVADELERSAGRAQARGGLAAAAAFLTRAAELTPTRARRVQRAVNAASANVQAGALDTARGMLDIAREGPFDDLQQARMDLVRAQLAFVSRRGNEAAPLLLAAARRLEPLDPELARATYLDTFSAAQFAARLNDGVVIAHLVRAARSAPRHSAAEPTSTDLLLEAFAAVSDDRAAAVPAGRAALARLRGDTPSTRNRLRLLWQGSVLALELWDDESAYELSGRHLQTVREAGALSELPLALSSFMPILVFCGEVSAVAELVEEARSVQQAAGLTETAYGALTYGAWRGQEVATRTLIGIKLQEARSRGEGIGIAVCEYAHAVLCNSLSRYDEALAAARVAAADPHELVVHNWGLTELVESATRTGRSDLARDALERLSSKALASRTSWALGMEARARALVNLGGAAEDAFRESVEHLGQARVRAELARSHLLYGEWLRREDRRSDARRELSAAHSMFSTMGIEGFAERAGRGLMTVGATVPASTPWIRDDLTAQEENIARLARNGMSNPEIGARLFISARTVEWHLRKVFTKLGISSRRELKRALTDRDKTEGTDQI